MVTHATHSAPRRLDGRDALHFGFLAVVALLVLWSLQPRDIEHEFGIREATVPEAKRLIEAGALVLDVREPSAARISHIVGAVPIPLEELRDRLASLGARDRTIVVYGASGTSRGPEATAMLNQAGYAKAVNLRGGIEAWRAAGHLTRTH